MSEKLSPERLAEIRALTRAKISDLTAALYGPRELHSGDCNARALLDHIDALEQENQHLRSVMVDSMLGRRVLGLEAQVAALREALEEIRSLTYTWQLPKGEWDRLYSVLADTEATAKAR